MVKIFYSGLVNKIDGKFSHSVLSSSRGLTYLKRHNAKPTDHRSSTQVLIRQHISDLSGEYYSLSDSYKELWDRFAAIGPNPLSGINCFVQLNQRLLFYFNRNYTTSFPPKFPSTPPHPRNLSVAPSGPSSFSISWISPALSTVFIVVNYRPVIGIERINSLMWKFGSTAVSSNLSALVSTSLPAGFIVKFKVRSIDLFGRVSPWSHVLYTTSLVPGMYGYSPYGYSYYNS